MELFVIEIPYTHTCVWMGFQFGAVFPTLGFAGRVNVRLFQFHLKLNQNYLVLTLEFPVRPCALAVAIYDIRNHVFF